jgi:AraC family transcriptional regulator, regulatory protein of adaptative response / DNA-3-methyladenine glycosylase II
MELDRKVCDRARRSRDARFDGKFFIAVTSTRIYCRPICPARSPKDENVRYYRTAAEAQADGFRPARRAWCRAGCASSARVRSIAKVSRRSPIASA